MANFCVNCGSPLNDNISFCPQCGTAVANKNPGMNPNPQQPIPVNAQAIQKSRVVAGLLGIFLGGWGIHNFYLGYNSKAIWQILATIFTFGLGALWGFVEGIMILCGSINTDGDGYPLKD